MSNNPAQNLESSLSHQHGIEAPQPIRDAAANAWTPESHKNVFNPPDASNTERAFQGNDDAANAFLAKAFGTSPLGDAAQPKHIREFNSGTNALDRSGGNLQDALCSINGGNVDGAIRDITRAMQNSDRGVDSMKEGIEAVRGQTAAKGDIKDGLRDVGYGKNEMQNAIDSLKSGNTAEAKEAIQAALLNLSDGKEQIGFGVSDIVNYKPAPKVDSPAPDKPETPSKPESPSTPDSPSKPDSPSTPESPSKPDVPVTPEVPEKPDPKYPVDAHMKELRDSGRHFGHTKEGLDDALVLLARGDNNGAIKKLGSSLREVTEGIGDLKYGANGGNEHGIPDGNVEAGNYFDRSGRDASDTRKGIIDALSKVQNGDNDQAIDTLVKSIKAIISAHKSVDKGYELLKDDDKADPRVRSRGMA